MRRGRFRSVPFDPGFTRFPATFRAPSPPDPVLRFRVHDPRGPLATGTLPAAAAGTVSAWDLRSAYLVGADGRPTRGEIVQAGSEIVCRPEGDQPVGIALLVEAGEAGRLVLRTCFLPPREEPYELFLEIARWLIKQWVEECEQWQMWRPALSGESLERWEKAREVFRAALAAPVGLEKEGLACASIVEGIRACEGLAVRYADYVLPHRARRRAPSPILLGVCIDPAVAPTPAATAAAARFDAVAIRTPWRLIERAPGKRDFRAVDAWVEWCRGARKPFVLGPLADFGTTDGAPNAIPDHVLALRRDAAKFRESVWRHARELAERYAGSTALFLASSGANCAGWHEEGVDRMVDLTRISVGAVRDAARQAKVLVELRSPGAEGWRGVRGTAWPMAFVRRLAQESLGLAALGVRIEQGGGADPVRDLMSVAAMIDAFNGAESPVFVTGFGLPSAGPAGEVARTRGYWHAAPGAARGSDPATQREWGSAVLRMALARTFIEGAWWSRLQDADGATDGVLDESGRVKPVLEALFEVRGRILAARRTVGSAGA